MLKAIVFDVDGVLLDSEKAIFSFFKDMLKTFGFPKPSEERINASYGKTTKEWVLDLTGKIKKEKLNEMMKWAHEHYFKDYLFKKAKLFSNTRKVLEVLSKDYLLFILSNNEKKVLEEILEKYGIKKYFKKALSREDVKKYKPNPEGINKLIKEFKLKKEEIIYVGDTEIDVITGNKARIKTIIIGKREINLKGLKFYRIKSISELSRVLRIISK